MRGSTWAARSKDYIAFGADFRLERFLLAFFLVALFFFFAMSVTSFLLWSVDFIDTLSMFF